MLSFLGGCKCFSSNWYHKWQSFPLIQWTSKKFYIIKLVFIERKMGISWIIKFTDMNLAWRKTRISLINGRNLVGQNSFKKKNSHPLYYHRCCFCEEEASATAAEYIFNHPSGDSRSLSGRSLWAATDWNRNVAVLSSMELQTKDYFVSAFIFCICIFILVRFPHKSYCYFLRTATRNILSIQASLCEEMGL